MKNKSICHFQFVFVIVLTLAVFSSAFAQELEDVIFLQGDYINASNTNACTIFSGNVDSQTTSPKDGANYLLQSSIGWHTPATIGWVNPEGKGLPDDPKNAAEDLVKSGYQYLKDIETVFYSYYQNDDPQKPDSIYLGFDYFTDHLINGGGEERISINGVLRDPEAMFDEIKSANAMQCLFVAFNMNPYLQYPIDADTSIDLRYLLLDIPYYKSVALLMRGNLALDRAFCVRFFEELRVSGTVINDELEKFGWDISFDDFDSQNDQGAWKYFNEASQVWLDLFASPIQRAYLLEFAPVRTLDYRNHPAFKNTTRPSGFPSEIEWPPVVYEGYKDVAAMMRSLAQRARVVHEVAKRLVLKLERVQATDLIETHVQEIALEEGVIMSMFFPDGLPEDHETKYPGLAESFSELRDAVTQLGQLREAAVNERLNALGFDKDVLFIRSIEPTSTDRTLYTYDWLVNQLLANDINPIGALGTSYEDDEVAKNTRKNFELKASTYLSEFDRIEDEYDAQLIAICGPDPENPYKPNLTDPLSGGGLLEQQNDNIEIAMNAIERVTREMENVRARIEIEQDRVAQLKIVSDKRIRIIYDTGGKVAQLQREIAEIQGQMAIANAHAGAASSLLGLLPFRKKPRGLLGGLFSAGAQVANGYAQADMQRRIGEKEAAMTRLNAEKEAKFVYFSQEDTSINSAAQIKGMFLDLRILEIDMFDAEIQYAQEIKRLAQLYNDIENKIMRRERALDRLTRRSFADPTYRIEVTNASLKAEDSFQVAQTWVYFLAKALDYKYPLTGDSSLKMTLQEILMARTADKLKSLVNNMRTYNMTQQGNPGAAYFYWNYSLRKDHLGMTFDKEDTAGNEQTPKEQFREYLKNLKNDSSNIVNVDNKEYLAIPFSTVKFDIPDDNTGSTSIKDSEGNPRQASATPIFQTGLWDSKIDWVQVNIEGNRVYTLDTQKMEVFLWYGGSGFVRTRDNFTLTDSEGNKADVDFLVFQNPAYSFSYQPSGRGFGWKVLPYVRQKMTAKLITVPEDIPDFVFKNEAFRERPVAATDWKLLIPANEITLENIDDIKINILYTARTRQYRK